MKFLALVLFAIVSPALAYPPVEIPVSDVFALNEFAGDLIQPFGASGAYATPGFPYTAPASLPETIQVKLAVIKRGLTRLQLLETWEENGGLTMNEFFLRGVMLDHRTVAVRVALRPAAMPEAIYADRDRRCRWLSKHKPFPNPEDVVMRVSKPFFGQIVID